MSASPATVTRETLVEMMQAYRKTALLRAGVTLGVFDALASGPARCADLAERLKTDERGLRILLNALVAIGLARLHGDHYALPEGAAPLLSTASPRYMGHMLRIFASDWEWDAFKVLAEAVRHGGAVVPEHAETPNFAYWEDFAEYATPATGPTAELIARELATAMDGRSRIDVLDVACGHGIYGYTLARHDPRVHVTGLDWPNVLPIAERNAERMGVRERCSYLAGDMFTRPLGGPYDVVLITNVLHHFSIERAELLVRRARDVLRDDGRLIVVGFMIGDEPPEADPAPHLFSVLMLSWTTEGEVHRRRDYLEMLDRLGFARPSAHSLPGLPLHVLIAPLGRR